MRLAARQGLAALLVLAAPALAAAQQLDAQCALLSKTDGRFARTPLPGFDPAGAAAPLTVPKPPGGEALVLCRRATVIPELTDYRVPLEAGVPLALTDERRVLYLYIVDGKLQASFRRGQPSDDEAALVKQRIEQMQAAMQGQAGK